jgi:hypothetical protein
LAVLGPMEKAIETHTSHMQASSPPDPTVSHCFFSQKRSKDVGGLFRLPSYTTRTPPHAYVMHPQALHDLSPLSVTLPRPSAFLIVPPPSIALSVEPCLPPHISLSLYLSLS